MSYLGNEPQFSQYPSKFFNGNGTAQTIALDYAPPNAAAVLVFIDGVRQDTSAYTLAGTNLTFTGSVPSGTNNVQVVHMGLILDVGVPGDGTVTNAKMADDAIAVANLSATGTASAATYLRGDNSWAAVAGDIEGVTAGTGLSGGGTSGTVSVALDTANANTWTAGQRGEITALTSATTITPDFADSNHFSVTLAHNATFANPSNDTAGQSGSIFSTQDGTGSRTASWGTDWEFAGGTAPTLTTTAAAVDRIDYIIKSGTSTQAVATLAYA
jgi:hypothetical protein